MTGMIHQAVTDAAYLRTRRVGNMIKLAKYNLWLAGEYRVASELLKRGLKATVTFGNAKSADVVAYGSNRRATIIEVKTSQQKNFVTGFYNKYKSPDHAHPDFWVMVQFLRNLTGDCAERFFILTHEELALIQGERNQSYRARRYGVRPDEKIDWKRHYELTTKARGVDNVLVTDVEHHENRWDRILAFCGE
jgi:hypothetical protein